MEQKTPDKKAEKRGRLSSLRARASRLGKGLKAAFNSQATKEIVVNAGAMMLVRGAVTTGVMSAGAAPLLAAGAAVAATALTAGCIEWRRKGKSFRDVSGLARHLSSRETFNHMARHAAFAAVGGAMGWALGGFLPEPDTLPDEKTAAPDQITIPLSIPDLELSADGETEAKADTGALQKTDTLMALPDWQAPEPVPALFELDLTPAPTPLDQAKIVMNALDNVPQAFMESLARASEHGSAQGIKDIAHYLYNFTEHKDIALTLFRDAAEMGNIQAQTAVNYLASIDEIDAPANGPYDLPASAPEIAASETIKPEQHVGTCLITEDKETICAMTYRPDNLVQAGDYLTVSGAPEGIFDPDFKHVWADDHPIERGRFLDIAAQTIGIHIPQPAPGPV
jgi:hypothetical protein